MKDTRDKVITFRLSDEEYEKLKELHKYFELKQSEFIRRKIFSQEIPKNEV